MFIIHLLTEHQSFSFFFNFQRELINNIIIIINIWYRCMIAYTVNDIVKQTALKINMTFSHREIDKYYNSITGIRPLRA